MCRERLFTTSWGERLPGLATWMLTSFKRLSFEWSNRRRWDLTDMKRRYSVLYSFRRPRRSSRSPTIAAVLNAWIPLASSINPIDFLFKLKLFEFRSDCIYLTSDRTYHVTGSTGIWETIRHFFVLDEVNDYILTGRLFVEAILSNIVLFKLILHKTILICITEWTH